METIITFNEKEEIADVYTHNKALQKKCSKLCEEYPDQFISKGITVDGGCRYVVPKKRITVSSPRSLTPEQREQAMQNLKK